MPDGATGYGELAGILVLGLVVIRGVVHDVGILVEVDEIILRIGIILVEVVRIRIVVVVELVILVEVRIERSVLVIQQPHNRCPGGIEVRVKQCLRCRQRLHARHGTELRLRLWWTTTRRVRASLHGTRACGSSPPASACAAGWTAASLQLTRRPRCTQAPPPASPCAAAQG